MTSDILIVDDDSSIRSIIRMALEDAGMRVTEVANGKAAVVEHRRSREWTPLTRKLADWNERLKGERSAEAREVRSRLLAMQALVDEAEGLADQFLRGTTIRSFGLRWLMKRVVRKKISSST